MTISSVTRMWSRNGSHSSDDGVKFNASFREAYQVVHTADESHPSILNDSRVPQIGDGFTGVGPSVACRSRTVDTSSPIYSVVSVTYSGEAGPASLADSPLNAVPQISRRNKRVTEEIDTDYWGLPLTNSIGDPVQGLTTEVSDFSISIKRNFATLNMPAISQYLRSHNSDTFDGWAPGTARFREFQADEKKWKDITYHEVSAVIEFREAYNTDPSRAWFLRYKNEGKYQRVGVNVTFSGGGGTGAAAYAITNTSGAVTAVVVTNTGRDYTSAPTVTISGGTGATATASLTAGRVSSISVGAGGSGYKSKRMPCVDSTGAPVTEPVLLAANGTQLEASADAVWIERPQSVALPYNSLGLL